MAQQQERQHSQDDKPGSWLKSGLLQQQQGYFLPRMNKTCESSGTSPSFSQLSSSTTPSLSPSPSTSAPPFIAASASILLPAFGSRFLLCSTFSSFFSTRSLLSSSSPPFPALTKTASPSSPSRNPTTTEQQHRLHNQSHQDQDDTPSSSSSSLDSNLCSTPSAPITLEQATMEDDAGVITVITSTVPAPAPAPGQNALADYWTVAASSPFYLAAVAAAGALEAARSKTTETTSLRQQHSNTSLFSFTYLLRLLFLVMTTRHTSATPAPAPAPALQSSEPSQPASAEQKAIPPLSLASEPTTSNPPLNAPVKTNDPPSPARVGSDAAAPLPFPTSSLPQSFPHTPNTVVPVSPPASTVGPLPLSTTTTTTSSIHSSSPTNHHTSLTNHHTDSSQPSGTPYGTIGSSNESSNRIMLTVSLVVVFVVLAGMGLVVYCLFRRRIAKRRMHLFGGTGGSKDTSGSLDSSTAAGSSGIGSGGKRKSMTAQRQSILGGGSVIGTGGKGDPMTTALAEMQERQRRISDGNMSRALQAMTEKHQNALMTRRSSTLSLGGLHHHNHHQHHLPQNQQHPGSRVVSPDLGPTRPHSALGGGYWSGGGGPVGGVDPAGEGSRRATMPGGNIVIGSGDYVAGPLESSSDFRTTLYDDLYYPSPQFLYSSSGGGSSGANSSEQLLPPHHHHHHPHYYNSGPLSSANMSRRSSLSPGAYPTHPPSEMSAQGQNPSPIFRAKTISTGSGQSYQQQMQYQQLYPPHVGLGPHRSTPPPHSSTPPPHLNRMSVPQPPATIAPRSDDSSETVSNYPPSQQQQKRPESASVGVISSDTIPRTSSPLTDPALEHQENHHQPRRPHSMSTLQNNSSFTSPHGVTVGPDRSRSPPLMSSSTGNLLDQHPQHRASYDGSSQLIIPPSITTRRRSAMPSALGPSGGVTSPGGSYPYQQGYPQQQHPYGGNGQEYFQDGQQYPISPRPSSPYGYGSTPYQDHRPNHYQYAQQLSSTQMSREPDHQGKSEHTQDGGAGVGVGSSVKTASSSSSSSPGGTSNTVSTASTPTPTGVNLNSVRPKSPPPPQVWPSRSNGNGTGSGSIVHIAPAPPSSSSSSRASVTAAATGLAILTPVDRESSLMVDLQLTEVLDSPTDSSAH